MRYEEHPAPPPLDRWIKCLWLIEDPTATAADAPERVVPDGSMELVIHYGAPFRRRALDGTTCTPSHAALAGQLTNPLLLESTGPVGVLGVRFHPNGASAFLREPLAALTDRVVGLADIWGREGRELGERVAEAPTDQARMSIVITFLHGKLNDRQRSQPPVAAAVQKLSEAGGDVPIGSVAKDLGIGRRRLERGFRDHVGLSPKILARVLRFQSALAWLEGPAPVRWAELAIDCGYYDQAHLIRDFKAFAGMSPTAWLREQHRMNDHFTGGPE